MTATLTTPVAVPPRPEQVREKYWERYALVALLVGTAIAYVWGLGAAGWANSFYSAAVQAGSASWKAFFFGSSDAANSITVDKPPASLWVMGLSVRVFGLSSWSILVPQALMGVGSVALLWATVRRYFGPAAGLLAGALLAVTPVAVLMFRFNNPDALLVLLMIAAVWAMLRAVENGRTRWLVLVGVCVGFGFLTKQLAVMLIVPPLALTYLLAGPPKLGTRIVQLVAAGVSMVVAAGWWLLAVEIWPTSSRPWIGGSQHNSILELTLGYNGLGRLNGNERGSVTPGGDLPAPSDFGARGGMWGSPGITRMFDPAQGGQIAWLVPAALALLVLGIALRGRTIRTDPQRASFVLWGGWLLVTGLVFSYMEGIFHSYYTVALAPAVAALVASGTVLGWRHRDRVGVRVVLAGILALAGATAWMLLRRSPDFVPWLRWVIAGAAVAGVLLILVERSRSARGVTVATALAALVVGFAGQVAYAAETIGRPRQGAIVSAGPNVEFGGGGPGGMPRFGEGGGPHQPGPAALGGGAAPPPGEPGGGGFGGLLNGSTPGPELTAMLESDAASYTWIASTVGANSAAGYQLATELPVMPIGGFNGTDPSPTLAEFQKYVSDRAIHYFVTGGAGRMGGDEATAHEITEWIEGHFTSTEVDGVTVYDLTSPAN